jgi:hypothetical protein
MQRILGGNIRHRHGSLLVDAYSKKLSAKKHAVAKCLEPGTVAVVTSRNVRKRPVMRTLLVALLVSISALGAKAQELQMGDSVAAVPGEQTLEPRVQKRLEALGYKDLQLTQDVLVVRAKDESDQAIVLLVDPDTLLNLKIDVPGDEPSTTGSGSSDR